MANKRLKRGAIVVISAIIMVWIVSFFSPELAIRRHIFLHLRPIQSLTADITDKERHDLQHGHLYEVIGYTDPVTRDDLGVFYLRKHWMFWTVASVGTGN
ncbi:hypothetical protein PCCS19_00440 [Paenibacillus sp. CCS19]|uniref:hypothetical protein n=1 Tax=Paenibacillus sp. CCS19 TaxID=3158387 RepID=UPI002563E61B|nr:hypothetical protein [Paenibacillus cellulosilyticus]GMK36991.1 hypothetical protein PCCS19_00440 [Paenibacillus cellulosilyticus]